MADNISMDMGVDTPLTAPGKVLRVARDARGLTQTDVAKRLHMSMQTIKDIEADDYSHFSAAIYVKGYLHNYAALLGIDEKPLQEAFETMGFMDQLSTASQVSYVSSSIAEADSLNRSGRRIARRASWFVFALLVALVVAWWYGQRHHKHATIPVGLLSATQQHLIIPVDTKKT